MIHRIAPILLPNQLEKLLLLLLKGASRILRTIAAAGRSKVVWVHLENHYGQRRATFVSPRELNLIYWRWLITLNVLKIRDDERRAISRANYLLIERENIVIKINNDRAGVVVDKTLTPGNMPEILVDYDGLPIWEQPYLLEKF